MASAVFEGTSLVNMFVRGCWVNGIRRLIVSRRGDEEEFFEIRTEWSDRSVLYLHRSLADLGRLWQRLRDAFPEDRPELARAPLRQGGRGPGLGGWALGALGGSRGPGGGCGLLRRAGRGAPPSPRRGAPGPQWQRQESAHRHRGPWPRLVALTITKVNHRPALAAAGGAGGRLGEFSAASGGGRAVSGSPFAVLAGQGRAPCPC